MTPPTQGLSGDAGDGVLRAATTASPGVPTPGVPTPGVPRPADAKPGAAPRAVPLATEANMLARTFAIQASWNYEIMLGTGIGFCVEPALARLPGGRGGEAYRAALARESQYFNAHPYLAALAVGALARAELDGEPAARIERFRTALCGPLGSVGDRLVWAAWLPFCSGVGLLLFGAGASPLVAVGGFLLLYNLGHVALRAWGLHTGLKLGLRVAPALAHPVFRQGPERLSQAAALVGGAALPLALDRAIGPGRTLLGASLAVVVVGAVGLARYSGRVEGWRMALALLAIFTLYALLR